LLLHIHYRNGEQIMEAINYTYDKDADAIYIYLSDKPYSYTVELDNSRNINYAEDNTPIGIELLYVSNGVNSMDLPNVMAVERVLEVLSREKIRILV